MYKIVLLVSTIIIALSNAATVTDESSAIQTAIPLLVLANDQTEVSPPVLISSRQPEGCVCRLNDAICSEPGCSVGDNLNCDVSRGNIYYSLYDSTNDYYRNISACACPNNNGADGSANAKYVDDDADYPYTYTSCDDIATPGENAVVPTDVATNAVNCCYYCCTLDVIMNIGGD